MSQPPNYRHPDSSYSNQSQYAGPNGLGQPQPPNPNDPYANYGAQQIGYGEAPGQGYDGGYAPPPGPYNPAPPVAANAPSFLEPIPISEPLGPPIVPPGPPPMDNVDTTPAERPSRRSSTSSSPSTASIQVAPTPAPLRSSTAPGTAHPDAPPTFEELKQLYRAPLLSSGQPATPVATLVLCLIFLLIYEVSLAIISAVIVFIAQLFVTIPVVYLAPCIAVMLLVIGPLCALSTVFMNIYAATLGIPGPVRAMSKLFSFVWTIGFVAGFGIFFLFGMTFGVWNLVAVFAIAVMCMACFIVLIGIAAVAFSILKIVVYNLAPDFFNMYLKMQRLLVRTVMETIIICLGCIVVSAVASGALLFIVGVFIGEEYMIIVLVGPFIGVIVWPIVRVLWLAFQFFKNNNI